MFETVLNSIEGSQLIDGIMMNYFQCDLTGEYHKVAKLLHNLCSAYCTLHQVKRYQMFQLERYLAVVPFNRSYRPCLPS